jgi:hypothetical protein
MVILCITLRSKPSPVLFTEVIVGLATEDETYFIISQQHHTLYNILERTVKNLEPFQISV